VDTGQKIPNGHIWRIEFEATLVGGRDWTYPNRYSGEDGGLFITYMQSSPITPSPYAPSTTTTLPSSFVISSVPISTPTSTVPVPVAVSQPVPVPCPAP
jgi:hypothetical protein